MTRTYLTRPGGELELIERFLADPALRDLVEIDGGVWPEGTVAEQLVELESFSERWDFRSGDLRLVFHNGDESRTDARAERVYGAARSFGMLDPEPPTLTQPDFVVVLGGLATGVEPRVRYAAELLRTGHVSCDHVVGLGSFRPIDERERFAADQYAPEATDELGLLTAMLAAAFDMQDEWQSALPEGAPGLPATSEAQLRLDTGESPRLTALAARSSAPDERPANTADTYQQFAQELVRSAGLDVLIITSGIYLPYQHMDAVRMLGIPFSLSIESVGVPSRSLSPSHPPTGYLQEIRSTIRSASALLAASGLSTEL